MNDIPLKLQNIRIRGLGDVIDSRWIDIGPGMTYAALPRGFNRQGFLRALQTINPPFRCRDIQPFADYPLLTRQGKYQKLIRPPKRTIALAVFVAQPPLVMHLARFSAHLYETDRIEIGRRLDYSRWINFVEIASSTRWSEMAGDVDDLIRRRQPAVPEDVVQLIGSLSGTDRVKDQVRLLFARWLAQLVRESWADDERERLVRLMAAVGRQEHFARAKEAVAEYLPVFHLVDGRMLEERTGEGQHADGLLTAIIELVGRQQTTPARVPLLLVDEPDLQLPAEARHGLRRGIAALSPGVQCLYVVDERERQGIGAADTVLTFDMLM